MIEKRGRLPAPTRPPRRAPAGPSGNRLSGGSKPRYDPQSKSQQQQQQRHDDDESFLFCPAQQADAAIATATTALFPPRPRAPESSSPPKTRTSARSSTTRRSWCGRAGAGAGLIVLAIIPVTAFLLGSWQVQRLGWKTELIAKFEDRLVRKPLPLPPRIDPDAIHDFDFRRVWARSRFRHDQNGTRRTAGAPEKGRHEVLVNRGWVSKKHRNPSGTPPACPGVRLWWKACSEPWKKNMFTPDNRPDKGEFYSPRLKQMAELTGSQAVWVEATM
ncbi:COX1 assembly protein Shy1, partial [Apiospora phragmitis]